MLLEQCRPGEVPGEGFKRRGVEVNVRNVFKIYRISSGVEVQALRGVSLGIPRGGFYIVMGPSGSGKTTLLNIIGGVEYPTAGEIFVGGDQINKYSEELLERYRLCIVGYIFQSFNLVPVLTALENVILPMTMYGVSRRVRVRRAKWLLEELGLSHRMHHRAREMSGGEQQRVAIAVALANDPPLILADEPTAELDHENAVKIIHLLSRLSREHGKTVIASTHDPRIIGEADRVVLLEDGVVKGIHRPEEITGLTMGRGDIELLRKELMDRVRMYREELGKLMDDYRRGVISLEEFDEKYRELSAMIRALNRIIEYMGGES